MKIRFNKSKDRKNLLGRRKNNIKERNITVIKTSITN